MLAHVEPPVGDTKSGIGGAASDDAAAVPAACALIADAYGGLVEDEAEISARLLGAVRALSEDGWLEVRRFSALLEPQGRNLDQTEDLLAVLKPAVDAADSVGLKMRLLGLGSCSPSPPSSEIGAWWPQTGLWFDEIALVRETIEGYKPEDWRHLSDYGRSAAASCFPVRPSAASEDVFARLWLPQPERGRAMNSMTPILLLLQDGPVAQQASDLLTSSGALLNPRLVHLFCDDSNTVLHYWADVHPWETVIDAWKELVYEISLIWRPGENDGLLIEQFQRSITRSNYANPLDGEMMAMDQEAFDALDVFLRGT